MIHNTSFKGTLVLKAAKYERFMQGYENQKRVSFNTKDIIDISKSRNSTIIHTSVPLGKGYYSNEVFLVSHGDKFDQKIHDRIINAYTAASQSERINIEV